MNIRTDLITELKTEKQSNIPGVETTKENINDVNISVVKIKNDNAAKIIGKPQGIYCTISFPRLDFVCDTTTIINAVVK